MNTPKNSFGRSSNDALSLPALKGGVYRAKNDEEKTQPIFDILKNNIEFQVFSNEDVKAEDVIEKIKK
tara:strand:+ start:169 stop:372 length:204 start_codon:yes stop_codon:yes gene_type:complete